MTFIITHFTPLPSVITKEIYYLMLTALLDGGFSKTGTILVIRFSFGNISNSWAYSSEYIKRRPRPPLTSPLQLGRRYVTELFFLQRRGCFLLCLCGKSGLLVSSYWFLTVLFIEGHINHQTPEVQLLHRHPSIPLSLTADVDIYKSIPPPSRRRKRPELNCSTRKETNNYFVHSRGSKLSNDSSLISSPRPNLTNLYAEILTSTSLPVMIQWLASGVLILEGQTRPSGTFPHPPLKPVLACFLQLIRQVPLELKPEPNLPTPVVT